MKRTLLPLLIFLPWLTTLADSPYRTFTNNQGKRITASVVSSTGSQVVLRTPDGKQYTLAVSSLSTPDQLFLRNRGGQGGMPGPPGASFPPRGMPGMPGPAPAPVPTSVPPPAAVSAGNTSSTDINYAGMTLSPGWMPQRNETKRELLRSLAFYAKATLGNTAPGKEPTPSTVGGFSWLMPVNQAIARLPGGSFKLGERKVEYTCFPAASLTLLSYGGSFTDQGKNFNVLHLLLDAKLCVVSVEFVQQTPKKGLLYEVDGSMEPYYNFLTLTNNASTKKEVVYALQNPSSAVTMIQTVFRDRGFGGGGALMPPGMPPMPGIPGQPGGGPGMPPGVAKMPQDPSLFPGKVYEYVHWYLPAPLARCILKIAEKNGVQAQ